MVKTGNENIPVEIIVEPFEDESLEIELYKSLQYMSGRFEFIERDGGGIKVRVKAQFLGGEFPYEIGYVVVSDYDDRRFIVTQVDPQIYLSGLAVGNNQPMDNYFIKMKNYYKGNPGEKAK